MRILSAEFVVSAAAGWAAPRDADIQVSVVGRSNVGKSSLLNALARKTIARTSAAPGKTRLANIYRVELEGAAGPGKRTVYLVDLPGYGYARGGAASARELAAVAETFFSARSDAERRAPSAGTLLLVDSRHPGLDADRHAFEWLAGVGAAPRLVATKVDKLSRAERTRHLREIERVFGQPPLPVSSTTGEGLEKLWTAILRRAGR